jgi:polyhydroxybutyrate depolymerase
MTSMEMSKLAGALMALVLSGCAEDAASEEEPSQPVEGDGVQSGDDSFEESAAISDWLPWRRRDGGLPWRNRWPRRDGGPVVPDAGTAPASDAGTVVDAGPSRCTGGTQWKAGDTRFSITVGGQARSYLLHVPASYDGDSAVPLLVDFHGLFGSGQGERGSSGYAQLADREGFIVAYPDGVGAAWNIGVCCSKADDEAFIRALVARIESEGCIDPARVYATGFSMGGGMSHYLACNASDVFAAVAPGAFDLLVEAEMPCQPERPISVVTFRGTSDPIVPYRGGESTPPNGGADGKKIHFEGTESTFARWARLNGCTGAPVAGDKAGCQTYPQCRGGVEVTLCTKQGGGHEPADAAYAWSRLTRHTKP